MPTHRERYDEEHDDGDSEQFEKLQAPPDFDGPVEHRHCTDILCLVLIIVTWGVFTALGVYSIQNGDYRVILNPLDYDGNVCGTDYGGKDMTEYPNLYYVNSWTGGVCVKECPSLQGLVSDNATDLYTLITYSGIWQTENGMAELDPSFIQVADYSDASVNVSGIESIIAGDNDLGVGVDVDLSRFTSLKCTTETCFPNNDPEQSFNSLGIRRGFGFAYYVGDTYELFQRCYLTTDAERRLEELVGAPPFVLPGDFADKAAEVIGGFWTNLFADLWNTRNEVLGFGFGASFGIGLIYIFLLRLPFLLNGLVWTSIIATIGSIGAAGYFSMVKSDEWDDADPQPYGDDVIKYTRWASYILFAIAGIMALITCCMRRQIQIAIGCVKQAARAVNAMMFILLVPVVQTIVLVIFWSIWAFYAVHLASLGDIKYNSHALDPANSTRIATRSFEFDDFTTNTGWFFIFCFFWTGGFIRAVGGMVIALATSKWYFAVRKESISSFTVISSIFTTLFYHLGTCAFGSLIIAIVQTIRAVITYFQQQVKKLPDGGILNCVLCCCQCCFACLERCLKFLNKNAYVQCAIFGAPFCESARKAFFLILRNFARVGAVSFVSTAVLWIGKLCISSCTTAIAYYVIVETIEIDVHSPWGPLVVIFLLSYFVSGMCMDVFDLAITTILHCFIADEEMFDGRPKYAEGDLVRWVDKMGSRDLS